MFIRGGLPARCRQGPLANCVRNRTEILMRISDGHRNRSPPCAFGGHKPGGSQRMPSAELYRRHAATCHRLARAHSDKQWTGSLVRLAYEYEAKAAEIDGCLATDPRPPARP